MSLSPEASEAVRIAEKHLADASVEDRKALASDIAEAIVRHAGTIASETISGIFAKAREARSR
jgi:phenylpyruvate tautomerase PptA (4-oxalocrotonate tautomerase family)